MDLVRESLALLQTHDHTADEDAPPPTMQGANPAQTQRAAR
jgi:hypothetical protein